MQQIPVGDPVLWRAAAKRAAVLAVNRTVFLTCEDDPERGQEALFCVASATQEGEHYVVRVLTDPAGSTSVGCSCQAAVNARKCWHAAAALLQCGLLRVPPPSRPEPTEAAVAA